MCSSLQQSAKNSYIRLRKNCYCFIKSLQLLFNKPHQISNTQDLRFVEDTNNVLKQILLLFTYSDIRVLYKRNHVCIQYSPQLAFVIIKMEIAITMNQKNKFCNHIFTLTYNGETKYTVSKYGV